jgi:isopenicillin N synthase-like dioxygenase
VWPDIPDFRPDTEALIRVIIDTAVLVARTCDRFAEAQDIKGYESGYLERVVRSSTTTKARLLHYFPADTDNGHGDRNEDDDDVDDSWCTTHLDHGCLTGLTSAMFLDESADRNELPSSPDPSSGLYILSRSGQVFKVGIPRDCLAFQTGEALELITQGKFKAVPHFVKGVDPRRCAPDSRIARNTLAVFTQPDLDEVVDPPTGLTFGEFARGVVRKNTAG